jgi:lipopolysaccharide transport system ATP-binding protein
MYVRLAFSVAAHLEPDILLVDEVLAVGDAEFQKKCLGKMEEITSKSGRTILFVSHNMDAIQQLCPRTILLSQGKVQMIGPTEDVIAEYLKHSDAPSIVVPTKLTREFKILKIESKNRGSNPWMFNYKQPFEFEVEIESYMDIPLFQLGIVINSFTAGRIASVHNESRSLSKGRYRIAISVDNIFTPGTYSFTLDVIGMYYLPEFATFYINNDDGEGNPHDFNNPGMVSIGSTFTITTLKN